MKSSNEISMDYNRAIAMTDELTELRESFRQISQDQMMQLLSLLSSSWKGENADLFIRKLGTYIEGRSEVNTKLEQTIESIRRHAENVYRAEMEALRIAQERKY